MPTTSVSTAADNAVPVLSGGSVTRTSNVGATIGFTTSKAGTFYAYAVDTGSSYPELDYLESHANGGGLVASVTAGTVTGTVPLFEGAPDSRARDIYVVFKDANDNYSMMLKIEIPAYVAP